MDRAEFEGAVEWSPAYSSGWDDAPEEYANSGRVGWARSRRLGKLTLPAGPGDPGFKAYLGVQHVDPSRDGWSLFDAPQARFFVSWFAGRRCLGLRTFATLGEARDELWRAYLRHAAAVEGTRPRKADED